LQKISGNLSDQYGRFKKKGVGELLNLLRKIQILASYLINLEGFNKKNMARV